MSVRILKIVPTLLCGGTESQAMALGRCLDPKEYTLEMACLRRWGGFVHELSERGIPLSEYRIPGFFSLTALRQQAKFARDLVKRHVDVVHAYSFYGNVFSILPAKLARVPVVIASIRDRGAYLTPMQKRVQRYLCRFADCVLVNAEAVKAWLVSEGYNPATIVVIPNGVDLSRFNEPPDPDRLRADLGLPAGVQLVGSVSRVSRVKGLEHFLDAAAILAPRFPDARFLIVGQANSDEQEYENILKVRTDQLGLTGRVLFAGLRTDVPAVMAGLTVSVMPSLNEALSNSLLESMAAGVAVVATRVGGTGEAVVDGVTGLLVEPADPEALAASIARLLQDPALAARLGRAARQTIEERFSIERMAHATTELYTELLARREGHPFFWNRRVGHVLSRAD
jgi:glycosyltransferase involved in cell wall biosynthesis